MTATVAPFPRHQFFDNNGVPAAGYKLFTYVAGTTTKQTTYTDQAQTGANANPIILDSAGRCVIFLPTGLSWKFVLAPPTDTDPPTSPLWTIDNVTSVPGSAINLEVVGLVGENVTIGNLLYLSAGDGGRNAGQWYNANATTDYMSVTAQALGFALSTVSTGATTSIRITGQMTGLAGLAAGSVYYAASTPGAITATPPTLSRPVGIADSSTTLVMSQFIRTMDATTSIAGLVGIGTQTFAGAKTWNGAATFAAAVVAQSSVAITGALTVAGASTFNGAAAFNGGIVSDTALQYQSGGAADQQLAFFQITVSPPTGIPGSQAANTLGANNSMSNLTGVLGGDILVGVQKAATQTGLVVLPGDAVRSGTTAGVTNVRYANFTGGAITPTGGETYVFTVLRGAAVGTTQLCAVQITVVPTGIPASVATATTANVALTGVTGLLSGDILLKVQKNAVQAGLCIFPADLTQGGVTGAGAVTVRYANATAGTIVPTPSESYTFTVLRLMTLGTQTLTPQQVSIVPSGIPGSSTAQTIATATLGVTGAGLLATDTLIGVNLITAQAGLAALPNDAALGGVGSATSVTVRYLNPTVGAITPRVGAYTFTVLRAVANVSRATVSGTIYSMVSVAGVGNVDATESPIFMYQLDPSTLAALGSGVKIKAWGSEANNVNAKVVKIYFGIQHADITLPASAADLWYLELEVFFVTATTQTAQIRGQAGTLTVSGTQYTGSLSPTESLTSPVVVYVAPLAPSANDIIVNGFVVGAIGT